MHCHNAVVEALLIGRDREMAQLAEALAGTRAGRGSVVIFSGPAGIGKSWLLDQAADLASSAGVPVLRGSAISDAGMPDLWVWRSVLSKGRRLGLDPGVLDQLPGSPAQAEFLANAAVCGQLRSAAEPHALVVLLDDLQWADGPTIRLMGHLARDLPESKVLVVAGTRDPSSPATLAGLADVRRLSVRGWETADVATYLSAVVGIPFDQAWVGHLHTVAAGNPLYIRELVELVRRTGGLTHPPSGVVLPDSLRAALEHRLEVLSERGRAVVEAASIVGDELTVPLLAAVLGWGIDELTVELAEVVDAGVLTVTTTRTLRFDHPLLRRATYDVVAEPRRRALHQVAAEALADRPTALERVGPIASHLVRAAADTAGARRAVHACERAAAAAVAGGRSAEAAGWYRRAAELGSMAQLDVGRQAELLLGLAEAEFGALALDEAVRHSEACADLADEADRPDLQARAALVVRGVGGAAINRRVVTLCRRALGRLDADPSLQVRLWAQLAMALIEVSDEIPDEGARVEAAELVRRVTEASLITEDRAAMVDVCHAQERLASGPGSGGVRIELGSRLKGLEAIAERPESAVWAHLWRIDGFLQTGEITRADAEIAGLAAVASRLGSPMAQWQLLRARAARTMLSGDFEAAEALAREGKELAERYGDPSMLGQFYAYRLERQRKLGTFDADDRSSIAALADADPRPLVLAVAAEYLLAAGDEQLAGVLFARLALTVTTLPGNLQQPAIWSIAGELAAHFDDPVTAAACLDLLGPYEDEYNASSNGYRGSFARPLAILTAYLHGPAHAERLFALSERLERRVGAPAGLASAQLAHAQALHTSDDDQSGAVRSLVSDVIRTGSRCRMAPTIAAATRLLAELDQAESVSAAQLTPREHQIVALVADGLTNRSIANRLVISERTVESHVQHITTKLGLANRTQVAAWRLHSGRGR